MQYAFGPVSTPAPIERRAIYNAEINGLALFLRATGTAAGSTSCPACWGRGCSTKAPAWTATTSSPPPGHRECGAAAPSSRRARPRQPRPAPPAAASRTRASSSTSSRQRRRRRPWLGSCDSLARCSIDRGHRDERSTRSQQAVVFLPLDEHRPTWHVRRCCVYRRSRPRGRSVCLEMCGDFPRGPREVCTMLASGDPGAFRGCSLSETARAAGTCREFSRSRPRETAAPVVCRAEVWAALAEHGLGSCLCCEPPNANPLHI